MAAKMLAPSCSLLPPCSIAKRTAPFWSSFLSANTREYAFATSRHRQSLPTFSRRPTTLSSRAKLLQKTTQKRRQHDVSHNEHRTRSNPSSREKAGYAATKCAYIALGSNVGQRITNIEQACREIDNDPQMQIIRTSCLYQTKPMYVEDQEPFLNGACEIETSLEPFELLDKLQAIEQKLGRVKLIDKGPRNIDLDILYYGGESVNSERLTIPHPLMGEREFVKRPLSDILSARHRIKQLQSKPWAPMADPSSTNSQSEPMLARTPLASDGNIDIVPNDLDRRTSIMSILNMTPDSFSDGGQHNKLNIEALKSTIQKQIADGATIIDIGGQSSRPNAPDVTAEEELSRVLPVIKAIKSLPGGDQIIISVDTYRASVADAAIKAGAHIINDISAGDLDGDMLSTVAQLGCTYIMSHMRGTPATMQTPSSLSYPQGVVSTIAEELGEKVELAQEAGIRRWRIILDPGIGFAKTTDQNIQILRDFATLKADPRVANFPWLVGTSRKSFIGEIVGVKSPRERLWGTAATVTAAIQGGADIVRVHDIAEMTQVTKTADAIYRGMSAKQP